MGYCSHHGTFLLWAVFAGSKSVHSSDLAGDHLAFLCLAMSLSTPICSSVCSWRSLHAGVCGGQAPWVSALEHSSSCWSSFLFCL